MIDLHTHLLPGIDDGADSWETAVAMCRAAAADGCEALVATPHQRHPLWWNDDLDSLRALRAELQSRVGPHPRVHLGAEVRADGAILQAIDSLEEQPCIQRLGGSRYILLEFGMQGGPEPEAVVHEMSVAGWTPVLAHPECIPWLADDLERLDGLVRLGARLQITAMSVLGDFGRGPRDASWALLGSGLVHVMASDCHNLDRRPPGMAKAAALIERKVSRETAVAITSTNPRAILEDRAVDVAA